jgi:hypothetical protein
MHPFLTKLGVPPDVQQFFAPCYRSDHPGNLVFDYGSETEHFGFACHRIPAAAHWWQAGERSAQQVVLCSSAMEAIAFLSLYRYRYSASELLFIALGTSFVTGRLELLKPLLKGKKSSFIFGGDTLGRLHDIQTAAFLRGTGVGIRYAGNEFFHIRYRDKTFSFAEKRLTLNAFEKASGARFGIRTHKAKTCNTFLEQLIQTSHEIKRTL